MDESQNTISRKSLLGCALALPLVGLSGTALASSASAAPVFEARANGRLVRKFDLSTGMYNLRLDVQSPGRGQADGIAWFYLMRNGTHSVFEVNVRQSWPTRNYRIYCPSGHYTLGLVMASAQLGNVNYNAALYASLARA